MRHNFFETKERFSIRKYSIGVASVLLSTLFFAGGTVFADEMKDTVEVQSSIVAESNDTRVDKIQQDDSEKSDLTKIEKNENSQSDTVATTDESPIPTESTPVSSTIHTSNSESVLGGEESVEAQSSVKRVRSKREVSSLTEDSATTFVKTGDTITVQNPNVEVNFPNGNSLYAPAETVLHMELPDELEIKQNDKIVVDIPDAIRIPTSLHYDVTGPSGEVIGNAFLDSVKNKVVTTFTDYFEKNKISKQFTLTFSTGWKSYVKPSVPTELNFSGRKITVTVGPETAPVPVEKTKVTKYGEAVTGHPELIRWTIRLNSGSLVAPQILTNYQLIDTLPDDQELVQDGDPVLNEFDANTKATWRLGHATDIPSDHVDLWNGKALRAEKVQSISPWVSKGNAIQLLENIKESSNGFSFKIAQLNELVYVRYMTRLKQVPNTNEELQQQHGNDIKITYNSGEEQSYQATFAFKADGSGSATKAKKPARVDLSFTKQLDGRKLKAGEFTFNLIDQTGQVVDSQTNDSFGHITFIPQLFNHAGVYHYTVEETPGTLTGINYDRMKAEVTITVNDNGDSYVAQTTMPADTEFNNTFTPSPVKVNLEFNKALSNGNLNAGDFSFTITGDNNVNETVTNKADGKINFSELSFDQVGVYNYTVKEVKGDKTDVDYDDMTIAVKVTVTKDEDSGQLTAKTEINSTGGEATGTDDITFNNHVVAPVTAQFDFSKALAGRTLKDGEFSFVLKDENGRVLQTKKNDADGKVAFDALMYKNNEVGVHKYTVEEVAGSEAGMTYDPMKAEVTVTVTKDGHTLTAIKALPTDTEFNNTFTPTATSAQFNFTKKLEGKSLEADAFTFELLENGNVIQTKKNAADGTIQFDAISYDKEGTHTYTVREVAGTDTDIDYDSMTTTVIVTVTKDATTGLLSTKTEMTSTGGEATGADDTIFNNYFVAPVKAQFNFTKKLEGRELKAGEFSFVLKDEKGNVIETVTNNADGKIQFSPLTFKRGEEGTYVYHVEEVKGTEAGVIFDHMIATVSITVKKDGKVLTATTQLPEDTEFNNTVIPPTPPTSPTSPTPPAPALPETGEVQSASAVLLGAALGMVGLVGIVKRKKVED